MEYHKLQTLSETHTYIQFIDATEAHFFAQKLSLAHRFQVSRHMISVWDEHTIRGTPRFMSKDVKLALKGAKMSLHGFHGIGTIWYFWLLETTLLWVCEIGSKHTNILSYATYHSAPRYGGVRTWMESLLACWNLALAEEGLWWATTLSSWQYKFPSKPMRHLVLFSFLGPGLPRIQPFATNAFKFTVHIMFKEHGCLILTF